MYPKSWISYIKVEKKTPNQGHDQWNSVLIFNFVLVAASVWCILDPPEKSSNWISSHGEQLRRGKNNLATQIILPASHLVDNTNTFALISVLLKNFKLELSCWYILYNIIFISRGEFELNQNFPYLAIFCRGLGDEFFMIFILFFNYY